MNICFTSPSKNAYSETFIQNIKDLIEGNIFYCYGGFFPLESEDGKLINYSSAPLYLKVLSKLGFLKKTIPEIFFESYLKKSKIQVVFANYGPSGAVICEITQRLQIPLIVHFHGFDASVQKILSQYSDGYDKLFRIAKAIIVVSIEMKNNLIQLGANPEKVFLLRYAPSSIFYPIKPNYQSNQILVIGRFVEKKAPYLTLLAIKMAQEKCPNLKVKFVGEGDLLPICMDISYSLGIESVEFVGVKNPEEIAKEMSNSFCFVQHSKTAMNGDKEGTPVAILEAMASGLPIISTSHAGIQDIIKSNVNGFLVNERDVDGMAKAIRKLYKDRILAKDIGQNNKVFIRENLSIESYKKEWDQLIEWVVNGK